VNVPQPATSASSAAVWGGAGGRGSTSSAHTAHAQARAALSRHVEGRLAELRRLDARKSALELATFSALWLGGAAMTTAGSYWAAGVPHYVLRIAGTVLSAIALNAYALLLHEGMHHTLFRSRFWNRWISVLLGATVLMSVSAWKVMHLRHHAYLGDPRDPDDYHNYTRNRSILWLMHCMRLLAGSFLYIVAIPVLALRYGRPPERRRIAVEYAVLGALYALVVLVVHPGDQSRGLFGVWVLPLVLVAYMTNVRGLSQHGIADACDPYLASRTMKPHPLVVFCLLNENYHLEHHLFPEIPGYNLAKVHRLIWHRLPRAVTGTSYLAFLTRFLRAAWSLDETPIGLTFPAPQDAGGERR
jgi:fatty acid desaturase